MKQHAIPQNILEVEFKLFTKFTVREFAYIAIGVGFGGIFLYLFSKDYMPAIIAIPIFLVSSGVGLALALVPVNDQNADVFLGNFFAAIRKPTLRVWRSERFDEKFNLLAQQRGINLTQTTGTMDRTANSDEQSNTRVVGGTAKSLPAGQFMNQDTIQQLDQEEYQRMQQLEEVAVEELGPLPQGGQQIQTEQPTGPTVQINYDEIMQQPQLEATLNTSPPQQNAFEQPSTQTIEQAKNQVGDQVSVQQPVQQVEQQLTTEAESFSPNPTDSLEDNIIPPFPVQGTVNDSQSQVNEQLPPTTPATTPTQQSLSDQSAQQLPDVNAEPVKNEVSSVSEDREILIDKTTAQSYKTEVEDYKPEKGDIALFVSDKNDVGVAQATILIKNEQGNIVQALQSDPQGLVLPKKQLPKGSYKVSIEHGTHKFPDVNFILEDQPLPVVNIDSINEV